MTESEIIEQRLSDVANSKLVITYKARLVFVDFCITGRPESVISVKAATKLEALQAVEEKIRVYQ